MFFLQISERQRYDGNSFGSSPSERNENQLSERITEAGFKYFTTQHINDLPLIQRDKRITCEERWMTGIKVNRDKVNKLIKNLFRKQC